MKVPCKDCLTLAICRAKVRQPRWTIMCPLINAYSAPRTPNELPMYVQTRINKVRKTLGLKKARRQK